jgi:hypothetical protein
MRFLLIIKRRTGGPVMRRLFVSFPKLETIFLAESSRRECTADSSITKLLYCYPKTKGSKQLVIQSE